MPPRRPNPLSIIAGRGEKARESSDFKWTQNHLSQGKDKKSLSKVKERSGNVYENKGSAFHSPEQGGNVVENKDGYEFEAGMLLKINGLVLGPQDYGGRRG
jgi:hypothetical protein